MAERGCGKRKPGGLYFETKTSAFGQPIEFFLVDPPIPVDDLELCKQGQQLTERDGKFHAIDWVGSTHYPNVLDYVEETRRMGASRRVGANVDLSKLSPGAKLLLVHDRAFISNFPAFCRQVDYKIQCPKRLIEHSKMSDVIADPKSVRRCCAGFWWRDIPLSDLEPYDATENGQPLFTRKMPSFEYRVPQPVDGSVIRHYRPAIFLALPITNLCVINGGGEKTERSKQWASQSSLPLVEADE